MDLTLLKEGSIIMAIGMGTVFFFLIIMIVVMNLNEYILKFIGKYFPEEIPEAKNVKRKSENNDDEIAIAIACAIHQTQKAQEIITMENNNEKIIEKREDKGALWAILLMIGMIAIMAILKHFIG